MATDNSYGRKFALSSFLDSFEKESAPANSSAWNLSWGNLLTDSNNASTSDSDVDFLKGVKGSRGYSSSSLGKSIYNLITSNSALIAFLNDKLMYSLNNISLETNLQIDLRLSTNSILSSLNNEIISLGGSLSLSIRDTEFPVASRIFYPWLIEVNTNKWLYEAYPFARLDYVKLTLFRNDMNTIRAVIKLYNVFPSKVEAVPTRYDYSTNDISESEVTLSFSAMSIDFPNM